MRLEGKVAVVTGAGSGIGLSIAERFVVEGAKIVAADLKIDGLSDTFSENVLPIVTDVSNPSDVAFMIAQAIEHFGKIDILINNAGIAGPIVRTHELTDETFAKVININLMSQFYTIKNVIPHFLAQGHGCIVNMASLSSFPQFTASADYCASKAAVKRLTESVAYEYAGDNIRVNAVAPGHIETPIGPHNGRRGVTRSTPYHSNVIII